MGPFSFSPVTDPPPHPILSFFNTTVPPLNQKRKFHASDHQNTTARRANTCLARSSRSACACCAKLRGTAPRSTAPSNAAPAGTLPASIRPPHVASPFGRRCCGRSYNTSGRGAHRGRRAHRVRVAWSASRSRRGGYRLRPPLGTLYRGRHP